VGGRVRGYRGGRHGGVVVGELRGDERQRLEFGESGGGWRGRWQRMQDTEAWTLRQLYGT